MKRFMSYKISKLRPALKPFRLHFFPRLRSTSDHAAVLRKSGKLFAPAIVLCGRQIAGRGRGVNSWWSNSGCLTATFALPIQDRIPPQQIPLLAGVAVRQSCATLAGDDVQLKWPNDVWHNGRKLAGLLCERIDNVDLLGIGLNVSLDPSQAPRNLRDRVTSLKVFAATAPDVNDVLMHLSRELLDIFRRRSHQPFSVFVREYEKHHVLAGKMVTVQPSSHEPAITGRCEGIDSEGRLILRRRGQAHRIIAGQVILDS